MSLDVLYDLIPQVLPFECLKVRFMQQALVGLLLLAPMAAAMGVQVVNFRMAFSGSGLRSSGRRTRRIAWLRGWPRRPVVPRD